VRSEEMYRQVLEGRSSTLGRDHPMTLTTMKDLGCLLNEIGKCEEAEHFLWKALEGRMDVYGHSHLDTIASVSAWAMALERLGKQLEVDFLQRMVKRDEKEKVPDSVRNQSLKKNDVEPIVGEIVTIDGDLFQRLSSKPMSPKSIIESDLCKPLSPKKDVKTLLLQMAYHSPEGEVVSVNETAKVERLGLNAAIHKEISLDVAGPVEPASTARVNVLQAHVDDDILWDPVSCSNELIHTCHGASSPAEITRLTSKDDFVCELGCGVPRVFHKQTNPKQWQRLWNASDFPSAAKKSESAEMPNSPIQKVLDHCAEGTEILLRRALEDSVSSLGPTHVDTLRAQQRLASTLKTVGKLQEAESLYQSAVAGWTSTVGPKHPSTLASLNGLVALLKEMERYHDAELLSRRALAGCCETLGPVHVETLVSIRNLAELLRATGREIEAEILLRECPGGVESAIREGPISKTELPRELSGTLPTELIFNL